MFWTFNLENTTKHKPTYTTFKNTRLLENKSRESYLQSNPQRSHVKIKSFKKAKQSTSPGVVLKCLGHMVQHLSRTSCFFNKIQSTQYNTQNLANSALADELLDFRLHIFQKRFAARL